MYINVSIYAHIYGRPPTHSNTQTLLRTQPLGLKSKRRMRMKRTNGARAAEQVPKREKERVREAAPHKQWDSSCVLEI